MNEIFSKKYLPSAHLQSEYNKTPKVSFVSKSHEKSIDYMNDMLNVDTLK